MFLTNRNARKYFIFLYTYLRYETTTKIYRVLNASLKIIVCVRHEENLITVLGACVARLAFEREDQDSVFFLLR